MDSVDKVEVDPMVDWASLPIELWPGQTLAQYLRKKIENPSTNGRRPLEYALQDALFTGKEDLLLQGVAYADLLQKRAAMNLDSTRNQAFVMQSMDKRNKYVLNPAGPPDEMWQRFKRWNGQAVNYYEMRHAFIQLDDIRRDSVVSISSGLDDCRERILESVKQRAAVEHDCDGLQYWVGKRSAVELSMSDDDRTEIQAILDGYLEALTYSMHEVLEARRPLDVKSAD